MLPAYTCDDQQSDFFSNDEYNLDSLFNDEMTPHDHHDYPPPHPNPFYSDFMPPSAETSNMLTTREEETHPLDFPPSSIEEWLNHNTSDRITVDDPGTTLHLQAPSQPGPHDPNNEPFNAETRLNIGNYLTNFCPSVLSMDGVSMFPHEFQGEPKPLGEPLPPPVNRNHRASTRTHQFLFHPYSHQPGDHESQAPESGLSMVQPPLLPSYAVNDPLHVEIVRSALDHVIDYAVNVHCLLNQKARKKLVKEALNNTVNSICPHTLAGTRKKWVKKNKKALYQTISDPFKKIMIACKRIAQAKIQTGYRLRPEPWSGISEHEHQRKTVQDLIDDNIFPPKFSVGNDGHALENRVVWDIILNALQEVGYQRYLRTLDSMMPTAIVAVYYVLSELSSGRLVDIEFGTDAFKDRYDALQHYINQKVAHDIAFSERWKDYEQVTRARLLEI
ncbi:hypothetical protein EV424DRAFT_1348346 [Suillus variegatus]|nr:hypothetical protein EV424DRAFT_1348346 [Suillus variegatus]